MAKRRSRSPLSPTVSAGAAVVAALATVAAVVVTVMIRNDSDDSEPQPVGAKVEDLARATVRIQQLVDHESVWQGSGSIVSPDGLILTAGHLVDDRTSDYDTLEVAVFVDFDKPPEAKYEGEVVAVDYTLDLAVVKVTDPTKDLPFVKIGDSKTVDLLEDIRVLGFPSTGGGTITATSGKVSGFTPQESIGDRAWIKTEADIGAGGSGGLVVNDDGELVAVPLIQGSGSDEAHPLVDCEKFADTNEDGLVDDEDSCISVSGFIFGLRPINLAKPLIDAANDRVGYEPLAPTPEPEPAARYELGDVDFSDLAFFDGSEAQPQSTERILSGVTSICATWEYHGMEAGMRWFTIWFVNGQRRRDVDDGRRIWAEGPSSGLATPVCIENSAGFADGLYELGLSVESIPLQCESVIVGNSGSHATSSACYTYFSVPEDNE